MSATYGDKDCWVLFQGSKWVFLKRQGEYVHLISQDNKTIITPEEAALLRAFKSGAAKLDRDPEGLNGWRNGWLK